MNKHDVIKMMGRFPDKIITNDECMKSKIWKCSACDEIYEFEKEQSVPSPCKMCGGIFFEKLKTYNN